MVGVVTNSGINVFYYLFGAIRFLIIPLHIKGILPVLNLQPGLGRYCRTGSNCKYNNKNCYFYNVVGFAIAIILSATGMNLILK